MREPSCPVFIAWSMSSASPPRTSPTTIRSGRMRSAFRTRARSVTSPRPSTFAGRDSRRATWCPGRRSSAASSTVDDALGPADEAGERVQKRCLPRFRSRRRRPRSPGPGRLCREARPDRASACRARPGRRSSSARSETAGSVSSGPSSASGGRTAFTRLPSGKAHVDHRARVVDPPAAGADDRARSPDGGARRRGTARPRARASRRARQTPPRARSTITSVTAGSRIRGSSGPSPTASSTTSSTRRSMSMTGRITRSRSSRSLSRAATIDRSSCASAPGGSTVISSRTRTRYRSAMAPNVFIPAPRRASAASVAGGPVRVQRSRSSCPSSFRGHRPAVVANDGRHRGVHDSRDRPQPDVRAARPAIHDDPGLGGRSPPRNGEDERACGLERRASRGHDDEHAVGSDERLARRGRHGAPDIDHREALACAELAHELGAPPRRQDAEKIRIGRPGHMAQAGWVLDDDGPDARGKRLSRLGQIGKRPVRARTESERKTRSASGKVDEQCLRSRRQPESDHARPTPPRAPTTATTPPAARRATRRLPCARAGRRLRAAASPGEVMGSPATAPAPALSADRYASMSACCARRTIAASGHARSVLRPLRRRCTEVVSDKQHLARGHGTAEHPAAWHRRHDVDPRRAVGSREACATSAASDATTTQRTAGRLTVLPASIG